MKVLLSAVTLALLLTVPAAAHEIILQVDPHGSRLLSGHFATQTHGDDHGHGHHHEQADGLSGFAECGNCPVERAVVLLLTGDVQAFERPDILPGAGAADAAVTVLVVWPARARTRDGVVALTAADPDRVLASWRSRASFTHLRAWPEAWPVLLGEGLELQLLGDPAANTSGNTLQARVLRDGVPITGVTVTCNGEPAGVTDGDGLCDVHPGAHGLQRLGATLRLEDPEDLVDELRLNAALTFDRK